MGDMLSLHFLAPWVPKNADLAYRLYNCSVVLRIKRIAVTFKYKSSINRKRHASNRNFRLNDAVLRDQSLDPPLEFVLTASMREAHIIPNCAGNSLIICCCAAIGAKPWFCCSQIARSSARLPSHIALGFHMPPPIIPPPNCAGNSLMTCCCAAIAAKPWFCCSHIARSSARFPSQLAFGFHIPPPC